MLESIPVAIIIGILLGFLAGLGVGGGSLLILWLTLVLGIDAETARAINLMFFITAAGSVSFFRWRQGVLQIRVIIPAMISGCIAAAAFSVLSQWIDQTLVKRLFGSLLLITGFRELFYRPRKAR
jgi:uncharacterized membrane protein YfcA